MDGAVRELAASLAERSGVAAWVGIDPHVNWLEPDPRYREIVGRLGLQIGRGGLP
jgi:hypothetical protein